MRTTININDIEKITGKWVVQLNDRQEDFDLTTTNNDGFWLEKRISYASILYGCDGYPQIKELPHDQLVVLSGIYYAHGIYSKEEFVDWFNNCMPLYNKEGKGRFMRLLTPNELDWLNEKLKENLYK